MNQFSKVINLFSIIKQIPIFSQLNWLQIHGIVQKSALIEYKKGEIICLEGTPPDAFYCLVSGRLLSYTANPQGKKDNIEFILRGMHFGIISLFTGLNHSLTVEALNDSIVLKVPKDDFLVILKNIPHLGIEFSQSLSHSIRNKVTNDNTTFESTIISIYSPVVGSGSSTYAINFAMSLQRETKKRVIYVMISSSSSGKIKKGYTETRFMNLGDLWGDHTKIMNNILRGTFNVDLLQVFFDPQEETVMGQISQFVSTLVSDYQYVVVDLPNDMDDVVMQTLTQSDIVQLITLSRQEDLTLTRQVIEALQSKLKEKFHKENIQVMLSGLDGDERLSHKDIHSILNYGISTVLPFIHASQLNKTFVSETVPLIIAEDHSQYAKVVTRVARRIGGVLVGLALGGGAALGVAHIGVIRVLEENNIPIDMVVGSSMGALVASMWTVGNNADQLEVIAREFEKKSNMLKLFDPVFPKSGFIGGRLIKLWLRKHLGDKTFYDTKIPLRIVTYDLIRREEHILEEGSLVDAVRESVAIPGVIQPILKEDRMLIDGGVLNPLPTNALTAMGIKKIIAVNVLQSPTDVSKGHDLAQIEMQEEENVPFKESPLKFIGVRFRRFFYVNIPDIILRTLQASEYVIAEQSATQANVLIHPELVGINWFELDRVDQLIKSGEEATRRKLPEIKKLIGEIHAEGQ